MPRNLREYLLRYADQADNDLDRSLEKLKQLADIYRSEHPDYAQYVDLVAGQIVMAQDNLKLFRDTYM